MPGAASMTLEAELMLPTVTPSSGETPNASTPLLTVMVPVNGFAPVSVHLPVPVLTMEPALMTPSKVASVFKPPTAQFPPATDERGSPVKSPSGTNGVPVPCH